MIQEQLKNLMLNSTSSKDFLLLESGTLSAKDNMQKDEDLVNNFTASSLPIFRVYTWEKSFTYGMSQKIDDIKDNTVLIEFKDNHAKRITGGGILYHGNDISYSLLIPASYVKNLSVKESYELICSFLLEFYKNLGLKAIFAKDDKSINLSASPYCKSGYEAYDILVNGKKVGGNAQRRKKELVFQHGSISIDKSCGITSDCLEDLGINISFNDAKTSLINAFKTTFNVSFQQYNMKDKYDNAS